MAEKKHEKFRDLIHLTVKKRSEREKEWKRNIRFYDFEANHWASIAGFDVQDKNIPVDRVAWNLVRSNTKRIVPSVYFRNPKVLVTPKRDQDFDQAPFIEKLLNYTIDQIGLKVQMKRCVTDALLTSMAVMKGGYDSEFIINKKSRKNEDRTENTNITPNYIWNLRVSPFDFYPDHRATNIDLSDADLVTHKIDRLLSDVKKDPYYENTGSLKANKFIAEVDQGAERPTHDLDSSIMDEREVITLWEIWDRKEMEVLIMAEGHDRFLKQQDWPWELEGFPFTTLSFDYTPDELYSKSDVDNYISVQKAIDIFLSIVVEHAERSLPKIIAKGLTDIEVNKLNQPLIDLVVKVGNNAQITPFIPPAISQDLYSGLSMLREIANTTSGVSEFQKGQGPRNARTATAANIINQASQVIQSEQGDLVQDFFLNIMKKDLKLMQQTYDLERIIPIVGNEPGVFKFEKFNKEQIKGEFDIMIEPYSALQRNPDQEQQKALQFTSVMKQLFPELVDNVELAKDLGQSFRKNNIGKIIPQLGQQQQQEPPKDPNTENLILATGGEVRPSANDPHEQHIPIHQAARESMAANGSEEFILQKFDTHVQEHQAMMQPQQQAPQLQQIPGVPPIGTGQQAGGMFAPTGVQAEEQAPEFLGG